MRKSAIVCGAGGFIASHLVKRLKAEGYWVRGVDIKQPEFSASAADEFRLLDLRKPENCADALTVQGGCPDEVYQLAADMAATRVLLPARGARSFRLHAAPRSGLPLNSPAAPPTAVPARRST
jgi:nucleoside-diphosphate-sugar epimerase